MASQTGIAWTESTWNPSVGCTVLTPGCTNCYAMREAARIAAFGGPVAPKYKGLTRKTKGGPVWTGELRLWEPALAQPLRWGRPRMIFVNSMSDLAHEDMPVEWFARIWATMTEAQQKRGHVFQVLTKRPANLARLLRMIGVKTPAAGIWLGISAEDEKRWDERVPLLKDIPTVVPWVSVEPQLELIDRDPRGSGGLWLAAKAANRARRRGVMMRSGAGCCAIVAKPPACHSFSSNWARSPSMETRRSRPRTMPVPNPRSGRPTCECVNILCKWSEKHER